MFWVLMRARLRMLRNGARSMPSGVRWFIAGLVLFGGGIFSLIGVGCAAFVLLLQTAQHGPHMLSAPAAQLVSNVYQYLFFFLLAGSVPFVASSLFQDNDLPLLLTTPVNPTAVIGMKLVDATASNAGQFVVLGLPVLIGIAWAVHFSAAGWFCFWLGILFLMIVTPAITALLLLILARTFGLRRIRFVTMFVSIALALGITLVAVSTANKATRDHTIDVGQLQAALRGEVTTDQAIAQLGRGHQAVDPADPPPVVDWGRTAPPWLPSTWASAVTLDTAEGDPLGSTGLVGFAGLSVATLLLLPLCILLGRGVVTSEAILEQRDLEHVAKSGGIRGGRTIPGTSAAGTGMIVKDLRYIGRDTIMLGQIGTTLILFLVPFVLKWTDGSGQPNDAQLYGWLAMSMDALVVYMVTSIIGLSLVGIDGKGVWLVLGSPMSRGSFLQAKWLTAFTLSLGIVTVLTLIDAVAFGWSPLIVLGMLAVFVFAAFGLSGLGVGLAGIFPRFLYDNPAHRASIWAMMLGFVFATSYICIAGVDAVVALIYLNHGVPPVPVIATSTTLFIVLSVLTGLIPITIAERRLMRYQWEL